MQTPMDRHASVPSARFTYLLKRADLSPEAAARALGVELDTFNDYYFGTMMPPNMVYLALEHLGDKLRGIDFE
jgi:hypothetical protein